MAGRWLFRLLIAAQILLAGMHSAPLKGDMVYRFEPSLGLFLVHEGDVFQSPIEEERSDQLAILRAVLPLVAESRRTVMSLSYSPQAQNYSTYTDLNRLDHRADFGLVRLINPRSNLQVTGAFLDTSSNDSDLLEEDVIIGRSGRQLLTFNGDYSLGLSNRLDLSFRYQLQNLEFDEPELVDSTSHSAGISAGFEINPRSIFSLDYAYQFFNFPDEGDYGTHNILTQYFLQPSELSSLLLTAGAFFQDYRPVEPGTGDVTGEGDTGFIGSIAWSQHIRRVVLNAELSRRVRPSGGIGLSVLSHSLRLSLSAPLSSKSTIALLGLVQRNEPTASIEDGNTDLMRSSLDIRYNLNRYLGLWLVTDYVYQRAENELLRDLSYPRVMLGLEVRFNSRASGTSIPG